MKSKLWRKTCSVQSQICIKIREWIQHSSSKICDLLNPPSSNLTKTCHLPTSFTLVKNYTQTKLLIILHTYLVALINLFSPLKWYVQCCTSFLEKGDSPLLCPQNKNNITCKKLSKLNIAGFQEFRWWLF